MLEVVSVLSLGPRWGALLLCGMHLDGRFYPFYLVRLSGLKRRFFGIWCPPWAYVSNQSLGSASLLYSSCTREEKPFKQMQLGSNIILVTVASSGPVLDSKMASVVLYYQEKYVQRSSRGAQPRPAPQLETVWCAHVSAAPCISPGRPAPAPQPQRLPPLFADSAAAPPPPHCSSN